MLDLYIFNVCIYISVDLPVFFNKHGLLSKNNESDHM
jgi:hypothetical protein